MKLIRFVSACCAVILLTFPAAAETLVLNDTSTVFDGEMYGATGCNPEFPLQNCQFLNRGGAEYFTVGKKAAHISTVWRTLMGFDFSDLPDHALIELDSAILTLTCANALRPDTVLHLGFQSLKHNVIEGIVAGYMEWTDSSFTWSARSFALNIDTVLWQTGGAKGDDDREATYYTASTAIDTVGTYRVDMTGLFEYWLDSSATERWCVLGDTVALGGGRAYARKEFRSSEYPTASETPKLDIYYTTTGRRHKQLLSGGIIR